MRNLKRALSLALALVMVLSMMVVGASAVSADDFSDSADIVNKEAVTVLATLNVINGKDDGSYDPTGNVTRGEMAKMICVILNGGNDISVITPETNANNQMIFRDNTQKMVWGKNILLLLSSVSTGKTINRSLECLRYYSGRLVGIAAIFSAIGESNGIPVNAIFTKEDLPHYETSLSTECALCKSGQKIDAIVNSYGYSKI